MKSERHCPICSLPVHVIDGRGRPRLYCSDHCARVATSMAFLRKALEMPQDIFTPYLLRATPTLQSTAQMPLFTESSNADE